MCSRDDCPTANIIPEFTTNCFNCKCVVHLMCIGINRALKDVLFHQNIKIVCNKCVQSESKPLKPKSSATSTVTPINKQKLQQSNIFQYTSNDKLDEMFALLQNVEKTVTNTNEIVASHFQASKSYSDVLKEIKEVSVSTNERVNKPNPVSYAAIATRKIVSSSFPPINSPNKRLRKEIETPPRKSVFKGRALTSGTASITDHGLGDTVTVNNLKRVSPYAHLTKSIYVSRLQTSVTADKIASYIKTKVPELSEKDILLRMLVKKDQTLETFSFISFKLSCTEELYNKLIDSSFWPQHVMIGEFFERERKRANIGDFIDMQSVEKESGAPNLSSNTKNDKTVTVEDTSDMETS